MEFFLNRYISIKDYFANGVWLGTDHQPLPVLQPSRLPCYLNSSLKFYFKFQKRTCQPWSQDGSLTDLRVMELESMKNFCQENDFLFRQL